MRREYSFDRNDPELWVRLKMINVQPGDLNRIKLMLREQQSDKPLWLLSQPDFFGDYAEIIIT